jgi:N-acetylglutamate synthase-like GNAT family acetyltransferase
MSDCEVYVIEEAGRLIATVSVGIRRPAGEEAHVYVNQLAVDPGQQRRGLGGQLMDLAEQRAKDLGLASVRLDTAIPAAHLRAWYETRGYTSIGEAQWPTKTYRSVILEKRL